MPTVKVRPGEPDEYTIPFTHGWERQAEIGRMRRVTIDVDRAEAKAANLEPKSDRIELTGVDDVRLVDVETGGSTWSLVCYSPEWDANRAGFTDGGDLRQGDDQTLITNLVGEVTSWTAGTINSYAGPMEFVFNHAHRHEALRRIEKNVSGEIQFRDFGTVDYIQRLGTDRSANVELSASAGTIEQAISITERGRELDGTHIRVLGAHEGEAQLFANLVPSTDSGTYENRVDYTTSRWSDGDPKDWDRWQNKDVSDQATIEEEAAALGEELSESLIEAETIVPQSVGLNVGDTVQVVKPDANLDTSMRVHRLTRQAGVRNDMDGSASVVDNVLLSTRTTLRDDDDRDLRDIQRFNTAFQGSAVWGSISPGRGPVDSGVPYEIPFYYPEVEYEHQVELLLRGLNYRAYSAGGAAGGDHSHLVSVTHPSHGHGMDHTHGVSIADTSTQNTEHTAVVAQDREANTVSTSTTGWQTVDIASSMPDHEAFIGRFSNDNKGTNVTVECRLIDDLGDTFPGPNGVPLSNPGQMSAATITVPKNNIQIDLQVRLGTTGDDPGNILTSYEAWGEHTHDVSDTVTSDPSSKQTSDAELGTTQSESSDASGDHTHPPEPGVIEFANTPTNVNVIVNGTTVATNLASGTFEQTVDLSGQLNQGAWNTVEVTSDDLGHLDGTISILSYRQIGTA